MTHERPLIAVTGSNGFIGSNLVLRLRESGYQVAAIARETDIAKAESAIARAHTIFHLAGVNRPTDESKFQFNPEYTSWLADAVARSGRNPLIVFASSAKATEDSAYGRSKRAAEDVLLALAAADKATVSIWRLPNVYGKWSRPNYNSVVATFCHNVARRLPLRVDDPSAPLPLLYIDDLVEQWLALITADRPHTSGFAAPRGVDCTTVGELAQMLQDFADRRSGHEVHDVANGLKRRLFAAFVSALPIDEASYPLDPRTDARGSFVEILKTNGSGQFSYFTAHPGVTRGGHYHHSKVEKFLVAHGTGRFRFRHVLSGETFEIVSSAASPSIVETIPGWAHDVTNIGTDELVVFSWANERFDPARPDTHSMPLSQ
jgi:UDP-2-acetamido-2,6-beta-L-arabino-hexul-4-ose reductase